MVGSLLITCLSFHFRLDFHSLLLHQGVLLSQRMLLVDHLFRLQHRSHLKALTLPARYRQTHVRYFRRLCKDILRLLQHLRRIELNCLT